MSTTLENFLSRGVRLIDVFVVDPAQIPCAEAYVARTDLAQWPDADVRVVVSPDGKLPIPGTLIEGRTVMYHHVDPKFLPAVDPEAQRYTLAPQMGYPSGFPVPASTAEMIIRCERFPHSMPAALASEVSAFGSAEKAQVVEDDLRISLMVAMSTDVNPARVITASRAKAELARAFLDFLDGNLSGDELDA